MQKLLENVFDNAVDMFVIGLLHKQVLSLLLSSRPTHMVLVLECGCEMFCNRPHTHILAETCVDMAGRQLPASRLADDLTRVTSGLSRSISQSLLNTPTCSLYTERATHVASLLRHR